MGKYVVVDLEMCKVPREKRKVVGYHRGSETIQIGAVLLDEKFEINDEFNTFVRPEYGYMDWEIMKLTGINSKDLLDAPSMKVALVKFLDWIPEETRMVSWSDTDRTQIKYETEKKKSYMNG